MEEVEVAATEKILMLLKYLEHQMRLLEEVAMMVVTEEEILARHVSFVAFYELPPGQLDVDLNNLTPRTSAGLHTMGRSLKRARYRACMAQSTASVTISSKAWLTLWGILKFSKLYSHVPCLSNLSPKAKLSCNRSAICFSSSPMRQSRIGSVVLCCG
ncbi:hypothetical protein Tco_0998077 [Tanacetum coccineum]